MKLDFELVKYLANRDTDISEHLMLLYETVKDLKPKVTVELGAGQSTYVLAVATSECGGKFYSIDIYSSSSLRGFKEGKGLLDGLPEYIMIEGDDMEVVKTWTKPIDFLLIDTSHTFDHTKAELKAWLPFVRVGGKIAMHDTASLDVNCGVRKALDEFLEKNSNYSVVHYSDTKRIGLSVLTSVPKFEEDHGQGLNECFSCGKKGDFYENYCGDCCDKGICGHESCVNLRAYIEKHPGFPKYVERMVGKEQGRIHLAGSGLIK